MLIYYGISRISNKIYIVDSRRGSRHSCHSSLRRDRWPGLAVWGLCVSQPGCNGHFGDWIDAAQTCLHDVQTSPYTMTESSHPT